MKSNSTWYANSQRIKILMMSVISGHEYAYKQAVFTIRWCITSIIEVDKSYKEIIPVASSWEICLSMRQISLRERVEIAWFTRDI